MFIRHVTLEDLLHILELYKSLSLERELLYDRNYRTRIQKDGFLLGLETRDDLKKLIENQNLFLVAEEEGKIIGYLCAHSDKDFLDDENKTWFESETKNIYYASSKTISVHTVAVAYGNKKRGVAQNLLSELEKQLKEKGIKYLFSIITLGPLTNCASLLFHTKQGFKRLAISMPRKLFELDDYHSILMYKKLK